MTLSRPGKVLVSGSVAYDYLMKFPGHFTEVVVPDKMHRLSVSFLVDEMRRVRGGVAPNIAFSLAVLGADAAVVATAGPDAADYREWLESEGVDVAGFVLLHDVFTASFFVSTDLDQNQIATFYAGAMARAATLKLTDLYPRESIGLVLVAPNDPAAMAAHAAECRDADLPFVYDPSQQVARLSGEELLDGMDGAVLLIGNEYEFGVIEKKTGLSEGEIVSRVPVVVITRGEVGATIFLRGGGAEAPDGARTIRIPVAKLRGDAVDPTGVGDAFRAGLVAGRRAGLHWETAGRVGSLAAAFALEAEGPQPERYDRTTFRSRWIESFGEGGADAASGLLVTRP